MAVISFIVDNLNQCFDCNRSNFFYWLSYRSQRRLHSFSKYSIIDTYYRNVFWNNSSHISNTLINPCSYIICKAENSCNFFVKKVRHSVYSSSYIVSAFIYQRTVELNAIIGKCFFIAFKPLLRSIDTKRTSNTSNPCMTRIKESLCGKIASFFLIN